MTTFLLSMLGALIVAGIVAWLRRPRLAYLVPKIFSHTKADLKGQLAEITIFNRGFSNEEDIVLTLNRKLKYQVIGATATGFELDESKLKIPRLGSNKEITLILTINGGPFSLADIESCLSKSTTGNGFTGLELVPMAAQARLAVTTFLIVMGVLFFGITFGIDYVFDSKAKATEQTTSGSTDPDIEAAANEAIHDVNEAIAATKNSQFAIREWKASAIYSDSTLA